MYTLNGVYCNDRLATALDRPHHRSSQEEKEPGMRPAAHHSSLVSTNVPDGCPPKGGTVPVQWVMTIAKGCEAHQ